MCGSYYERLADNQLLLFALFCQEEGVSRISSDFSEFYGQNMDKMDNYCPLIEIAMELIFDYMF